MLTHEPGESNALADALFKAVKTTGCAEAMCASAPARETICRRVLIRVITRLAR
jgi:hypothetical protein